MHFFGALRVKNQYKDEEHVEHNTLSLVSDAVRVKGDKFCSIFWTGLPSPHQIYFKENEAKNFCS